jgi:hypothetical protein
MALKDEMPTKYKVEEIGSIIGMSFIFTTGFFFCIMLLLYSGILGLFEVFLPLQYLDNIGLDLKNTILVLISYFIVFASILAIDLAYRKKKHGRIFLALPPAPKDQMKQLVSIGMITGGTILFLICNLVLVDLTVIGMMGNTDMRLLIVLLLIVLLISFICIVLDRKSVV